ncbi:MAG: type II secretion system F family protein, partial [Actinomycetota bacterium]
MLYSLSLILVFISVFLTSMALSMLSTRGRTSKQASIASIIEQELAEPFARRILLPLVQNLADVVRRISPMGISDGVRRKLALAGNPKDMNVDKFLALKALSAMGTCVLLGLAHMTLDLSLTSIPISLGLVVASFFIPDLWLQHRINTRQKAIALALPDTLDLLTISVEAGLGFDAALSRVVKNTKGPLSQEFYRMLQEIRLGTPRKEAFKNLGERVNFPELHAFILAMLQADVFGI